MFLHERETLLFRQKLDESKKELQSEKKGRVSWRTSSRQTKRVKLSVIVTPGETYPFPLKSFEALIVSSKSSSWTVLHATLLDNESLSWSSFSMLLSFLIRGCFVRDMKRYDESFFSSLGRGKSDGSSSPLLEHERANFWKTIQVWEDTWKDNQNFSCFSHLSFRIHRFSLFGKDCFRFPLKRKKCQA